MLQKVESHSPAKQVNSSEEEAWLARAAAGEKAGVVDSHIRTVRTLDEENQIDLENQPLYSKSSAARKPPNLPWLTPKDRKDLGIDIEMGNIGTVNSDPLTNKPNLLPGKRTLSSGHWYFEPKQDVQEQTERPANRRVFRRTSTKDIDAIEKTLSRSEQNRVEYSEKDFLVRVDVASLRECKKMLYNDQFDIRKEERHRYGLFSKAYYEIRNTIYDILAAFTVYVTHTFNVEGILCILNSAMSAYFYLGFLTPSSQQYLASKMDFSILSFAVVFPLVGEK
mmetsp:Transcript_25831/g.56131  ORF Transcript_25831/g.56131 Transcript_25831/m.56131 type:complete len:280 (-) Transcript_25831:58-897(-)